MKNIKYVLLDDGYLHYMKMPTKTKPFIVYKWSCNDGLTADFLTSCNSRKEAEHWIENSMYWLSGSIIYKSAITQTVTENEYNKALQEYASQIKL